jgi:2-polyprenyl-3-methyl-5-hydroxy-6-metoxy-1,4-benzoquinol methylase
MSAMRRAADGYDGSADESIELVLFTEILEHITFNPVAMWQAIHRVLKADGKVIITTPNYYFWQSRAWDLRRFMRRMGGGIPVEDIVGEITYGHHWKEYSAREIVSYFSILPTNLHVSYMRYVSFNDAHRQLRRGWKISAGRMLEQQVGFFRDSIYAEVSRSEMTATT